MCPSVSRVQQQAMAIAYAAKTGKIPASKLKGASKNMAKMKPGDLKDFASTKHKGLPKRVHKKKTKKLVAESINEFISYPRLGNTYRNEETTVMEDDALEFAADVFFNEYLPTKGFTGNYDFPNTSNEEIESIVADFSTYMEQNYHKEWDPKYDRTLYKEIVQDFLKDPHIKLMKAKTILEVLDFDRSQTDPLRKMGIGVAYQE